MTDHIFPGDSLVTTRFCLTLLTGWVLEQQLKRMTSQRVLSPTYEFTYDLKHTIGDWLKCSICHEPLREATITSCKHTFCRQCIEKWHETCGDLGCPICRTPFTVESLKPDRSAQNALDKLASSFHTDAAYDGLTKPTYMYVDPESVDEDLKCIICAEPMIEPVTALCGHNFCKKCALKNTRKSLPCPSCNLPIADIHPVTMRSFINMLDKIVVQCAECFALMIRGKFEEHIDVCSNAEVKCAATDIGCTWIGQRGQLAEHAEVCPYTTVRPSFEQMRQRLGQEIRTKDENLQKSTALVRDLQKQISDLRVQFDSEIRVAQIQLRESTAKSEKDIAERDQTIRELRSKLAEVKLENEELNKIEKPKPLERTTSRSRASSVNLTMPQAMTPRPKPISISPMQQTFMELPSPRTDSYAPGSRIICGGTGGELAVIDLEGGRKVARLVGHSNHVYCLIRLDAESFASGGQDNTVRIWSLSGRCLKTLVGHTAPVQCLTKVSNGMICSGSFDHTIRLWDCNSGTAILKLDGGKKTVRYVINMGSRIVSCCDDGSIKVWTVEGNGNMERELLGHKGAIGSAISIDTDHFVTGGYDSSVRVWDIRDGQNKPLLQHTSAVQCLVLLSGDTLASGSRDNKICVWNWTNGQCLKVFEGHTGSIECLCKISDTKLASGSSDKSVRVWDVSDGSCKTLTGHSSHVVGVVKFGQYVASCGFDGNTLVFDILTGKCLRKIESPKPFAVMQLE
jgi:WD40 repeat protein